MVVVVVVGGGGDGGGVWPFWALLLCFAVAVVCRYRIHPSPSCNNIPPFRRPAAAAATAATAAAAATAATAAPAAAPVTAPATTITQTGGA